MKVNRLPRTEEARSRARKPRTSAHERLFWEQVGPGSERRLLEAAIDCFADKGFHGSSTRDIGRRAGMSPAAIYMHYASKEELLFIIAKVAATAMLAELTKVASVPGAPEETLRRLVATHVSFHATMSTAIHVASYELHALSPGRRRKVIAIYDRTKRIFRDAIAAGIDSGVFRVADLGVATTTILSSGIAVSRWYSPKGRLSAERLGEISADMVSAMLRGPGEAAEPLRPGDRIVGVPKGNGSAQALLSSME